MPSQSRYGVASASVGTTTRTSTLVYSVLACAKAARGNAVCGVAHATPTLLRSVAAAPSATITAFAVRDRRELVSAVQ